MAKSINVSIDIDSPIAMVWNEISNINNHANWMNDVKSIVTGKGSFLLRSIDSKRTMFTWNESLKFPIILGEIVGDIFSSYILKNIWKKNIQNLKKIIES